MAEHSIWSAENFLNIIPLVYGIPTFVLYFIVLFVLLYRFRTPFYLLFTINGISVGSRIRNAAPALWAMLSTMNALGNRLVVDRHGKVSRSVSAHFVSAF